jgi:hypothetical protein
MNATEQAVDSLTRITLQGTEFVLRLSGAGAKNLIAFLAAVAADQKKTRGKMRLAALLKSGKPLKVFQIDTGDLKAFSEEAKRYGVLYTVIKDKDSKPGDKIDVMATADDAAKISRIVDRLAYGTVDVADVVANIERGREGGEPEAPAQGDNEAAQELVGDLLGKPQDRADGEHAGPTQAQAAVPHPSEPISGGRGRSPKSASDKGAAAGPGGTSPPTAAKTDDGAERARGQAAKEQPEKARQTRHAQPKARRNRRTKTTKTKVKAR